MLGSQGFFKLIIPNGGEMPSEFSSDSAGLEGDESEDSTANVILTRTMD
ncbi:MAG: hypothetical protein LBS83_03630 [Holosporales bacterium]|nr:hypothetical protein [Holosporales bacterium]